MTSKSYKLLLGLTLAAFALALMRPEFVVSRYSDLVSAFVQEKDQMKTQISTPTDEEIDLSHVTFDPDKLAGLEPTKENDDSTPGRLIVPSMGVDAEIIIDDSQDALSKGLWHIPGSALPGEEGNIVIAAHRWLHKPPNKKTFYRIDEMEEGDEIIYEVAGIRYTYVVSKTEIVQPEDVHILSQDQDKLTLFTCHPLFSTDQRFVVSAELLSTEVF